MRIGIETLVMGGDGLGRWEGKVVFVPYGVPGDILEVEIVKDHSDYTFAKIIEVISPSPNRANVPCPIFGRCGGCQWLHIDYTTQLEAKEMLTARELRKLIDDDTHILPIIPSTPSMEYRCRAKLRLTKDQIGFYEKRSRQVVAMGGCPLMAPVMNRIILILYRHMQVLKKVREIDILTCEDEQRVLVSLTSRERLPAIHQIFHAIKENTHTHVGLRVLWKGKASSLGPQTIEESILGLPLRVGFDSFSQNNRFLKDEIASLILEQARPWIDRPILELYAGIGTFTLPLARGGAKVIAVEGHLPSARLLKRNVPTADVIEASCEQALDKLKGNEFPLIILDPPRTGCSPQVRRRIGTIHPQAILYISCNPPTMARDMLYWKAQGYRLTFIQPLDMFPHTGHVEAVGLMMRSK